MKSIGRLEIEEIRELGRRGEHPHGWFLIETDTLAYWMHLPHKDISNLNNNVQTAKMVNI